MGLFFSRLYMAKSEELACATRTSPLTHISSEQVPLRHTIMGAGFTRVRQQHQDEARLAEDIQQVAQKIVATAKEVGYDPSRPDTCNRLAFFYHNKLQQFNRTTLVHIAYNIGLAPTPEELRSVNKQQICDVIIAYYRRKIDLVQYIELELDGSCRRAERQIAANMEQMLEGASRQVQQLAYQRLIALNDAVVALFSHADAALHTIVSEDISPEALERYIEQVFSTLEQDKVNCCRRTHALRQFAWEPITAGNNVKYHNTFTNEVADRLPRITRIEPEFPVGQIPC